jgi:hypothetical protein
MSHLKGDYTTLLKRLHDVCMQAVYQLSPTDLYKDKIFEDHLLLNFIENSFTWKQFSIANQSSDSVTDQGRAGYLYEELQAEYNRISQNLMIRNRPENIEIEVDDDKGFGQNDPKKDTYRLKYTNMSRITEMVIIVIVPQRDAHYFQSLHDGRSKVNHLKFALNFF